MTTKDTDTIEITPDIINLVIARLKTVPLNAKLSIGDGTPALSPESLIEEVKKQSEIGKKIIETQLFFLRSLQNLPLATA